MDHYTRKHRTFETYRASRMGKPCGPGTRNTLKGKPAIDLQGSRPVTTPQTRTPRTAASHQIQGQAGLDRFINGMTRGGSQTRRPGPALATPQSQAAVMPPGMEAYMARMERVQQVRGPAEPLYDPSQRAFRAMRLSNGQLSDTRIIEWPEQNFKVHATPWERRFSQLVTIGSARYSTPGRHGFRKRTGFFTGMATPVVDSSNLVIAHVIKARGDQLWAPKPREGGPPIATSIGYRLTLKPFFEVDCPVYFDINESKGWWYVGTSQNHLQVLVAIDGRVLAVLSSTTQGNVQEDDCWLLDAIQIGGVVARVGANAVKKALKAVYRRAGKKAVAPGIAKKLDGRTEELAKEVAQKAVKRQVIKKARSSTFIPETGMPRGHFRAVQQVAKDEGNICVMRNTSRHSVPHIERGCPAKGLAIKANTDSTGIVCAVRQDHIDEAMQAGFFVVDANGVARRTVSKGWLKVDETLEIKNRFWDVRPGHVIAPGPPTMPVTADYDLMAVIPMKSKGSNVALVGSDGKPVKDITGPYATSMRNAINKKIKAERVMHGAQDQFAGYRGGATVFYPNGDTELLRTAADVEKFYARIGRKHVRDSYNPDVNSAAHQAARKAAIEKGDVTELHPGRKEGDDAWF